MAQTFYTLLAPTNNSGVTGIARLTLDGSTLHVDLAATGATPVQLHPIELLGLGSGTERLATAANDTNGNGRIEASEAAAVAGSPIFDLTLSGANTHGAGAPTDAPPAAEGGLLLLSQTYTLDPAQAADAQVLQRLQGRVLEVSGLNQPATDPATGQAATAYDATLPAAAGTVTALPSAFSGISSLSWLTGDANTFLQHAQAALGALAPYQLNQQGTGPLAPEPAGAATGATSYAALLLPSNNSGAIGATTVSIDAAADTVTVDLYMVGLTPNQVHASHIHGFSNEAPSLVPNLSLDADRDGFVEDQEGEGVIGPVILGLTRDGSISDAVLTGNYASADANGTLRVQQTYKFDASNPAQATLLSELEARLAGREVQVHGLDVTAQQGAGTVNEVDGTAGYKPNLPVANGVLLPLDGSAASPDLASLVRAAQIELGIQPAASDQVFA